MFWENIFLDPLQIKKAFPDGIVRLVGGIPQTPFLRPRGAGSLRGRAPQPTVRSARKRFFFLSIFFKLHFQRTLEMCWVREDSPTVWGKCHEVTKGDGRVRLAPVKQEREAFPRKGEQTEEANHPGDGLPERICGPVIGVHPHLLCQNRARVARACGGREAVHYSLFVFHLPSAHRR